MYILRNEDSFGITNVYIAESEDAFQARSYSRVSMADYDINENGIAPPTIHIEPSSFWQLSDIGLLRAHIELLGVVADEAEKLQAEKLAIWREQHQHRHRPGKRR